MDTITIFAIALLVYVAIAALTYREAYELRSARRQTHPPEHESKVHTNSVTPMLWLVTGLFCSGGLITMAVAIIVHRLTSGESWFAFPQSVASSVDFVISAALVALGIFLLLSVRRTMKRWKIKIVS